MLARMVREAKEFYDSRRSWEGIIPESMIQATEEYRQDEDPDEDFESVFVEDSDLRMTSTEAYRALCDHDRYYERLGQKAVTRRLKARYKQYLLPKKGRNVFEGVGTIGTLKARRARPLETLSSNGSAF